MQSRVNFLWPLYAVLPVDHVQRHDRPNEHFHSEPGLTKSQSAWVQFAHDLGVLLMAMPAGVLARKLGYKSGIIAGLVLVALGGFWFIPATRIKRDGAPGEFRSNSGTQCNSENFARRPKDPYRACLPADNLNLGLRKHVAVLERENLARLMISLTRLQPLNDQVNVLSPQSIGQSR